MKETNGCRMLLKMKNFFVVKHERDEHSNNIENENGWKRARENNIFRLDNSRAYKKGC